MCEKGLVSVVDPRKPSEDEVSIECLRSSEFVLGKQNNFNGPVTIINCGKGAECAEDEGGRGEESVVIRDKVVAAQEGVERRPIGGEKKQVNKWQNGVWKKSRELATVRLLIVIGLLGTAATGIGVFFAVKSSTVKTSEDEAADSPLGFYSKAHWGGKPPKSFVRMKLPIPYVVISHSVTPLCHSLPTCAPLLRNMQSYHLTLDFADIGYNFLVDSAGHIYEGRGWERRNVNGDFVNGRNIDVCLIGDYSGGIRPTAPLLEGLSRLLAFGLHHNYISANYALIAANSTYPTLSPGQNVYQVIKDWQHFDPDPKSHIKEYYE